MAESRRPQVEIGTKDEAEDMGLPDGVGTAFRALLSELSKGSRGRITTEALARLGYAEDPERLKALYQKHAGAIEAYFNEVNAQKLMRTLMESEAGESAGLQGLTKRDALAAGSGSVLTLLAQSIFSSNE